MSPNVLDKIPVVRTVRATRAARAKARARRLASVEPTREERAAKPVQDESAAKLANEESAARFRASRPRVGAVQERVLADLARDGIAITRFRDLIDDHELWADLAADMRRLTAEAEKDIPDMDAPQGKLDYFLSAKKKGYLDWSGLGPDQPTEFGLDKPWLRFALSPSVLDVVNSYQGLWMKLLDWDQIYTAPFGGAHDRVGSQRWHRDPEDAQVVKVFTYFSDVNEDSGPFEYIRGSAPGGKYAALWPWGSDEKAWYPPHEELVAAIDDADRVTATGETGTVVFCHTSGFHRGGFAEAKPRLMSALIYVSPAALVTGRGRRNYSVAGASPTALSPAARFAVS